jgi:fibronectin-binding autotransporter adhesin
MHVFSLRLASIFLLSTLAHLPLAATNFHWNVPPPMTGDWSMPINWLPVGLPTVADNAFIDNGGTAGVATMANTAMNATVGGNALASTINIVGGGMLMVSNANIGNGTTGVVLVTGFPGILNINNNVAIGDTGTGSLTVAGVGTVTSSTAHMGLAVGALGTSTVTGPGSTWTNTLDLTIGESGTAIFQVQNGGSVSDGSCIAGLNAGSTGLATTDGTGSLWTTTGTLIVADAGDAHVTIQNSSHASAGTTQIAATGTATGTLTIASLGLFNTGSITGGAGNSTFAINNGTLRAAGNSAAFVSGITAGQATITGGATIDSQNFTITIPQSFSGSGPLVKLGTGTLILTGTNAITGGTTISAGTLQVNTNSIPSGNVANNGLLIFDQGFTGTFSGNISGSGSLIKQNVGTLTLSGAISEAGSVAANQGALILTGTNSYLGGTSIAAGALLQGNTNSIPASLNIIDNGTLVFDQGFNASFPSNIIGSGAFVKQNIGTLILTGHNTYSSGTLVAAGTLQGDTNSIPGGPVLDNATLIFNQNFDGTFAGPISGAGSLIKAGVAKLQLTGNSGAFAGTTTIVSGNLNVNGILGGTTIVDAGAILSGTGFLGNVINNGTIKPGNSIGTIHVVNFINNPTGIYQVEINGFGASSQIAASGTASLNGGEIVITADPGTYIKGTTYTLINTGAGLTGTFATAILPTNVQTALTYLPNKLILTVLASTVNVTGLHGNALRTALYIRDHADADPDIITVLAALNTLTPAQQQKAYDQLHPALFEALILAVGDTTHMINSTFTDRLDYLRRTSCCDPCDPCACQGVGAWTAGVADFIRQERTDGLRRFTTSNEGLAFGFDNRLDHSLLAGVGAGYSHTNLHWGNSAGHADIDGYYLGAYATKYDDRYYIDGSILGFINKHHVRRHIHFATIDRRAKNKHHSFGFNPHLGAGVYLNYCTVDVIPFFDVDYYFVRQNRAREHGAKSLNLHVRRNETSLLRLETGLRFTRCFEFCCSSLLPNASISYVAHRVLSGKRYISSLEGIDATFSVFGTNRVFNQLELGAGLMYIIDDSLAVNTWYDVEFGHKRQEQEVNLEINYRF